MPALYLLVAATLAAVPGTGTTSPLSLEVKEAHPFLSRTDLRRALERDLDRPVFFQEETQPRLDALVVSLSSSHHATIIWQPQGQPLQMREADLPLEPGEAVEVTALLAGNLIRREALAVAEGLGTASGDGTMDGTSLQPATQTRVRASQHERGPLGLSIALGGGNAFAPSSLRGNGGGAFGYAATAIYQWRFLSVGLDMAQVLNLNDSVLWTLTPVVFAQLLTARDFRLEGGLGVGLALQRAPWNGETVYLAKYGPGLLGHQPAVNSRALVKASYAVSPRVDLFTRLDFGVLVPWQIYPPSSYITLSLGAQVNLL